MVMRREIRDENGYLLQIETSWTAFDVLNEPSLNKGNAFTRDERRELKVSGHLPYHVEALEHQCERVYHQYHKENNDLARNLFLNDVNDYNQVLFFKLVSDHLEEMLPIIYTPTIGEAVQKYSLGMRRPRGMFLTYPFRENMQKQIDNAIHDEVDLIIVTDGEGVLGIGDQGVGGMDISIGKLMVYTLAAGINPNRVLPVVLDVGTNNEKLLNDPMYMGWRHERLKGKDYDEFVDQFVTLIRKKLPNVYLHWEDFGRDNARRLLNKYRNEMTTFNDDMQGTAMVTLANVLAALSATDQTLKDQRIVIFGAGTAGVGIADQIYDAMLQFGLSEQEARASFYLIDRDGLVTEGQENLPDFQQPYIKKGTEIAGWQFKDIDGISLAEVVDNVHPTILIGCSTMQGAFTESIVKSMASHCEHPVIMPLSNPTSHCEANPADLIEWTENRALIAAGSPFEPVKYKGKTIRISQGNNAFIFPGLGLGVIACKAKRITDGMLYKAALALSECSPSRHDKNAPLLPPLSDVMEVSEKVAVTVIRQALHEGVAGISADDDIDRLIQESKWLPAYVPVIHVED